jgi:hypothetical protein
MNLIAPIGDPEPRRARDLVWWPQPGPQKALVDCEAAEVFFGGARGGGKTDGVLGKWATKERRYGRNFNAIMFRRTTVSAEDAIERSKEIYEPLGGKFDAQKLRWRMPNGGRVSFAYLESIADAQEYQGRNVTDAWVEEAGQFEGPAAIDRLFGVLRSAHAVPVQLVLTANPGGAGQHWIRARYGLHPFPLRPRFIAHKLPTGKTHLVAVIPSRIMDNKILIEQDPGYVDRLHLVGSAQLVKAWIDGDWSAIEGAFFDCWSQKNVVEPFGIPKDWLRFRSGDWGSYSPFSFGWWAVVQDDYHSGAMVLPRGALVRYREWYGSDDPANSGKGLKLDAERVAFGIVEREKADPRLTYGVLDPSTFKEDGGPSIAERINQILIRDKCIPFRPADNTRVPTIASKDRRGAMGGWDHMRSRIIGNNGQPMIYCFSTCTASLRTIPVLQHDAKRAEDLDTNSEDHAADEWRYACMSRPWVRSIVKPDPPRDAYRVAEAEVESFKTL